jgi:DNA helicase-2/ATP-dependent DNA helicase PcrA
MPMLNPEQQAAATHVEGPLLVLAGAGSGKTRVVTHRIAHLIDLGVLPSEILAVTFTNKAADEMRTRIRMMKGAQVLACTFHSLGARILRESIGLLGYKTDFAIYDEEDSEKLLKSCLGPLNADKGVVGEIREEISAAKNSLTPPQNGPFVHYQAALKECNAVDFDDLLYLPVKLLQENEDARKLYQSRWQFVLIDEYQDTNMAQYTLAKLLVERHRNIFAVGDPDQSIYSWRGARYQNILNFEHDFPGAKVIKLEQNYRSTNTILQASNAVVAHNSQRYEKRLWSGSGEGEKIGVFIGPTDRQEAEFVVQGIQKLAQEISLNDIAIFYRTNAQSRTFEDALLAKRIDYTIVGGLSFYARREIKDVLAFLRLIISNTDLISFMRAINIPKRGLGPATLEKITKGSEASGLPILTYCEMHASGLKLSAKQTAGLSDFMQLIQSLRDRRSLKIHELISEVLSLSKYFDYLKEDPETMQDRKENLDELIGKAAEWETEREHPTLQAFLEELTLRGAAEEKTFVPAVKLMTLHNSKGLEFPAVFLVGLEEDLCPHINSKDKPEAIEEERRLFYVGMTRAKKYLYLTASTYRFMWGTQRTMRPSRFLREVPTEYTRLLSPEREETADFKPGDWVYHQQFGSGMVLKTYRTSLGLTYEVRFPESNITRTLAAKYARLTSFENQI